MIHIDTKISVNCHLLTAKYICNCGCETSMGSIPWYCALNPFLRWLLSDVKCSRSQFLLEITGEGKVVPVNLKGSKQTEDGWVRKHSLAPHQGDMVSLILQPFCQYLTSRFWWDRAIITHISKTTLPALNRLKLDKALRLCHQTFHRGQILFLMSLHTVLPGAKRLAVLWGGLSSKAICSAGLESVYVGIEWVIISCPIMITSDHGGAQQWLTAESAKVPPIDDKTLISERKRHWGGNKTDGCVYEEGKAVEMERGGDGWKTLSIKKEKKKSLGEEGNSSERISAGTMDWLPMANGKCYISFSCTHISWPTASKAPVLK